MKRIYRGIGRLFPKAFRDNVRMKLAYAGLKVDADEFIGFVIVFTSLLSLVICFAIYTFTQLLPFFAYFLFFIISFATILGIFHFSLEYIIMERVKAIEESLPDALQLMAAHTRAGITPDKAVLLSARPEFGVLADEIEKMGAEMLTGKTIEDALKDFAKRTKSPLVKRVVALIVEGIVGGGEIATLLEKTADDIRMENVLKEEVKSNIGAYEVFTIMAILIAAPILFALSTNFVTFVSSVKASIGEIPTTISPFPMVSSQPIDVGMLKMFSISILVIASFFGALLLGVFREGEELAGLKFIPIMIFVSLFLYFATSYLIESLLRMMAPV